MRILAVRCSNTDFAYTVIKGPKQSPIVIDSDVIGFPKGYDEPALFRAEFFHEAPEVFPLLRCQVMPLLTNFFLSLFWLGLEPVK